MKAVIMAGGLGTRLRPLTKIIPKPLLPIGEKSILEITIKKLKEEGFDEIILAVNYKSDLFESHFKDGSKFGIKIVHSKEKKELGTAGPLQLVKKKLTKPFLVMNGDILTNMDFKKLKEFHTENKADMTVVTKKVSLPLHYGVISKKDGKIKNIDEKPTIESEINAGIYFLNPSVLDSIPKDQKFDMPDLIKKLIKDEKSKDNVIPYSLKDYWMDIGNMDDHKKAQDDLNNGFLKS